MTHRAARRYDGPPFLFRSKPHGPCGTAVVLGLCFEPDNFVPGLAVGKEVRIQWAGFYSGREFEHAIIPFERGDVIPRAMVTETVSLAQFPAAFEALRERTHQCKVMLNPWSI